MKTKPNILNNFKNCLPSYFYYRSTLNTLNNTRNTLKNFSQECLSFQVLCTLLNVVWYCGESLLHSVHMAFFELVVDLAKPCDAVKITDSFVGKINCP